MVYAIECCHADDDDDSKYDDVDSKYDDDDSGVDLNMMIMMIILVNVMIMISLMEEDESITFISAV